MKKILLASGCSWTDKNFESTSHPEMDCSWPKWPELLAKKLDMDCINLGKRGAGQEYIYSSLLEEIVKTNKDRIGLVMALWSRARREDFEVEWGWTNIRESRNGTIEYFVNRSIRYMFSLQILCERYNLPLKQFQMLPLFYEYEIKHIKNFISINLIKNLFIDKIDEDSFIGWPPTNELGGFNILDKLDYYNNPNRVISEEDNHPSAEGQKFIAELLYENIRS